MSGDPAAPTPPAPPGLLVRVRAHLSLSRVQATLGIIAALLSIGGALYGYLRPGRATPADSGEIVALVQDRAGKPVTDATVELLTPRDALVTALPAAGGEARRTLREGSYRLRVSHPRYVTETRQIQVLAGQTAEIRIRLAPRPVASPLAPAERAVNEGVESLKKIFR